MVLASGASPLALAVPSRVVQRFLSGGSGRRLGVSVRPVRLRNGQRGVMLTEVVPGGKADPASLLLGDILVEGNGRALSQPEDVEAALDDTTSNTLRFKFYRGAPNQLRQVVVAWDRQGVPHAA